MQKGVTIFSLAGNLNIGVVPTIRANIESVLASGQRDIVFDLGELDQLDSAGIATLIVFFKQIRSKQGEMKISRLMGQPREIFRLLRLDNVFEIYEDSEEAIKSFR